MEMIGCICDVLACLFQCGSAWQRIEGRRREEGAAGIKGSVVVTKKDVLGFTHFTASVLDRAYELLGQKVSFQLVSATHWDPNTGNRGKVSAPAYLEEHVTTLTSLTAGESKFNINFDWDDRLGIPGAVIVKNNHHSEFYLKSLTLENVPGKGRIHFVCNSWVYPASHYDYDRVFFTNDAYLPGSTPGPLKKYREEELKNLRGDEINRMLEKHDRIYGYACYNDLGDPDKDEAHVRPILGGSKEYPYPRRGRTGRRPTKKDPNYESRLPLLSLNIYVPRDELFGHLKMSDFLAYALKALEESLLPLLNGLFDKTPLEFDSLDDVLKLYEGGVVLPKLPLLEEIKERIPFEMIKVLVRKDGAHALRLPLPRVIEVDKSAWRTDEEFAREMLAGANPVIIRRLQVFPPVSKLDPRTYGNNNSSITAAHMEKSLEGLTIEQALKDNKLFILDHHDALIPYLNRINNTTSNKIYASRTLLFLKEDGTLKPLAIELSLPHPDGEQQGCISRVFTPAEQGVEGSIWQLAKAYVAVNDSGVHQLISHWLNTHAVIEPFVIATHRQLSVMHPIYKLLEPHYRDTMNINALARQTLINANGILESTVFPGKFALEMSSNVYKSWNFTEQALPDDLLKRGVAVEDPSSPTKLRLLIPDYPYAVDGLAIWSAIESWIADYCSIHYKSDVAVQADTELQAWWKEVREEGHGDLKDEPWWPAMRSVPELVRACATIVWVASALHAAVNFGQYAYAGYVPNRPTISRRFMPEPGTKEYEELATNPERVFLKTITSQFQTILGVSLIEVLSRHASDEVYLGQRDTPEWTSDGKALEAFRRFGERLVKIEESIMERNADRSLKNRSGPIEMPYVLLHRKPLEDAGGLGGGGVPNSISI